MSQASSRCLRLPETAGATAWYGAFMFLGGSVGPVIAAPAHGGSVTTAMFLVVAIALFGAAWCSRHANPAWVRYGLPGASR
ncbi:hypothetical protein NJ76_22300 [Rhodococcus sp. IITR03]|nr:hypothetical protein NJ76_22300 [Rhodococcus sp. IITR03]